MAYDKKPMPAGKDKPMDKAGKPPMKGAPAKGDMNKGSKPPAPPAKKGK